MLGLSLVALTAPPQTYLRQGCNLVPDDNNPRSTTLVHADGTREPLHLERRQVLTYAQAAAKAFGVGESQKVEFDPSLAKKDLAGESEAKPTRKARGESHRTKRGGTMMSRILCIAFRFIQPFPVFHGRHDGGQPEWPPSPMCAFQALVNAAAFRYRGRPTHAAALAALSAIEGIRPRIIAPSARPATSATAPTYRTTKQT